MSGELWGKTMHAAGMTSEETKRAIECVNACAGMDDPQAEIEALRMRLADLEDQVADLEAAREISLHLYSRVKEQDKQ